MIGCSRCGHVWDNCECPDLEEVGENRDIFEKEIDTRTMFQFLDEPVEDEKEVSSETKIKRKIGEKLVVAHGGIDELSKKILNIVDLGSHYRNEFKGIKVDVYRVLQIFGVTDPVAQHIVKKLLRGTKKGHDEITVWNEVFKACERKKEMIEEDRDEAN